MFPPHGSRHASPPGVLITPGDGMALTRRGVLLALSAGSTLYWWVAVPFIHAPDWDMGAGEGVLGCLLKFLCWPTSLWLVMEAYRAIGSDRRRARQASVGWAAATLAILAAIAFWRGPVADLVRTGTTHLTSPDTYIGYAPLSGEDHDRIAYDAWREAWISGRYLLIESTFFVLLAFGHGRIARSGLVQRSRKWAAPLAIVLTLGLAWAFTFTFGLMENTFDLFHHGIAVGCLALDASLQVVSMRPESAIAAPFALAYAAVGAALVTYWDG